SAPTCGDKVCTAFTGACESDGFHPCANGKVSGTAQECALGICVSTGGILGAACAHPLCSTGGPETGGCDSCANQICSVDPYCCSVAWDGICVSEVGS